MNKLERQMIAAMKRGKNWSSGNTRVHAIVGGMEIQLHGSIIATYTDVGGGNWEVIPNLYTFKKWPTGTTCSRLRALGIEAHIKNGQPCIDGKPL